MATSLPVSSGEPVPRLQLSGITKAFPGCLANDSIDLTVMPRRDPRPPRRERRGQEHPGQDHLRRARGRSRRIALGGRAGRHRQSGGGARARHLHGVPAFHALRVADRRREHRARRARRPRGGAPDRAPRRGLGALWLEPRSAPLHPRSLGRRAPARRDRALPAAGAAPPGHGRADLGADAPGGDTAVRDLAPARRRRLQHPLHLA